LTAPALVALLGVWTQASAGSEKNMYDRQVAALNEMMDAVNAGDAARYAGLYAPDAVITMYGSGQLEGRAAIERHEVELLRQFPGTRLAFYDVWQDGPRAVVHYGVNGKTAAGQAMGHEGLLFYRFHPSGLIEEERRYLDSFTPMAQLGLLGPLPARPLPALPDVMKAHVAGASPREADNVVTVRAALEAEGTAAFLASLAADAVVDELILPGAFAGRETVKAWLETWTAAVPDGRSRISTIAGIGESVLVELVWSGTLAGPLGRLGAAGKPFAVHRAAIVQLKGGRVSRIAFFMNGKELAEATGQWPPPAAR
jgi:uncharacterized protein (TIGR02246 family)